MLVLFLKNGRWWGDSPWAAQAQQLEASGRPGGCQGEVTTGGPGPALSSLLCPLGFQGRDTETGWAGWEVELAVPAGQAPGPLVQSGGPQAGGQVALSGLHPLSPPSKSGPKLVFQG